jgi:RNA polymerase sigma-70 factor (ECF subfamily)
MTAMIDDPNLPARIRARDPQALRVVIETYLGQIVRAARGAGLNLESAEDVGQATFTTFLEKAESFEGRSHVRTWLFGILYRKIAEARRDLQKESRQDDIDEIMEHRFDSSGGWVRPPREVDADAGDADLRDRILDCMEILPMQQRVAFYLRETEGLPSQEICKILDVTRTNLGVLLYRGRNRLRECLETKGVSG